MTLEAHRQASYPIRLEWGPTGAAALAGRVDVAVVVDVLSFTTTLAIAVERGMTVEPTPWHGPGEAGSGPRLLSPAAMLDRAPVDRLVLASPNGARICAELADSGATVVGACLRNAAVVADWLAPRLANGETVLMVPAGERWPDGSLRPAAEDLWGAGAVLAHLRGADLRGADLRAAGLSPEARLALAAYDAVAGDLGYALSVCASGRELIERGHGMDVAVAADLGGSVGVPVLRGAVFGNG